MEIQRIDSYTDPRFPQEVLYQHGAFLVDGAPWTFRVISDHEAEVTGEGLTRETLAEAAEDFFTRVSAAVELILPPKEEKPEDEAPEAPGEEDDASANTLALRGA